MKQTKMQVLDAETLFLLRSCAMEVIDDIQTNRTFHSEDELYSHLSTIAETKKYFTKLKMAIGIKQDGSYFVSESVLQRAFGRHQSESTLRQETLNYIAQFICDKNWSEYDTAKGRREAHATITSRLIKPEMKKLVNGLCQNTKPAFNAPKLREGDKILVEHEDGTFETFVFKGGDFRPLSTSSDMCA